LPAASGSNVRACSASSASSAGRWSARCGGTIDSTSWIAHVLTGDRRFGDCRVDPGNSSASSSPTTVRNHRIRGEHTRPRRSHPQCSGHP
jgi:hypothetical protein